jgi:glycosyltransferase involved in cell wall biosynthesis
LRILKISDVYFPRVNGVSTSIRTFTEEFTKSGHEVTLIAPRYPAGEKDEADIVRIPSRYLPMDPEDRMMHARAIKRLLPELKRRQFDIIHIHTPFVAHHLGLWLSRRLGIPAVESYHTYFEEYLDLYLPWLPRKLLRYIARRLSRNQCNAVNVSIVPTRPMLDVLDSYGVTGEIEIIPTGIPSETFRDGQGQWFRQEYGIAASRELLLYVGRVAHEKNIDFLIRMLARMVIKRPQVLLVIAGEGPAREGLIEQVHAKGLSGQVLFVGYLSRKHELANCYAAADIFVFASNTETQGLVLLEAMQTGTPVVTTAVMGTAEIMRDGLGGLIAKEDVDDFAGKVDAVLSDESLRKRLMKEAYEKAQSWDAGLMAQKMLELYDRQRSLHSRQDQRQ